MQALIVCAVRPAQMTQAAGLYLVWMDGELRCVRMRERAQHESRKECCED